MPEIKLYLTPRGDYGMVIMYEIQNKGVYDNRPSSKKQCVRCNGASMPVKLGSRKDGLWPLGHELHDKWVVPKYCFSCLRN